MVIHVCVLTEESGHIAYMEADYEIRQTLSKGATKDVKKNVGRFKVVQSILSGVHELGIVTKSKRFHWLVL